MEVIKTPSPRFRFLLAALLGAASYSDPRPRRPVRYPSRPKPRRNPLDKRPFPAGIHKDAVSVHFNHQKGQWFEWRKTPEGKRLFALGASTPV